MNAPRRTAICIALFPLAALALGGCVLDRSPILPGWSKLQPALYCPGDTLTASYDFMGEETCRTPEACAAQQPTVTMTSDPVLFGTRVTSGYADSFTLTPPGDSVRVFFTPDRNAVRVPTSRTDAEGRVIDVLRENVNAESPVARRIDGTIDNELVHEGMCAGSTPVHAPARRSGPPIHSENMRLVEVCNLNGVPVVITLSETTSGATSDRMVNAHECFSTSEPGMVSDANTARTISVRSLIPDPGARCSALGPNNPPAPLRTRARSACR